MSRLFAVTKSLEEIVAQFAVDMAPAVEVPSETVEGTPGLIVLEKDGLRLLKSIPWGFPRQTRDMRREGEPPGRIGLVADGQPFDLLSVQLDEASGKGLTVRFERG